MEIISKLNEAAKEGNIELLLQQLRSNPLILKTAAISSIPEHTAFVKEFLKHDDEFVRQLNYDGLSRLHIAAAIGNVEIVKEILKGDLGLCLLKGRETKIPLRLAIVKGKVVVVRELLLARLDSVETVTSRGETALHLAVRNYQFDVLCDLMEHVKRFGKVEVINKKDERGNTILHLAAAKKQHEVIDLMLKGMPTEIISSIEVNSLNKIGYTALDLLLLTPSEAGDRETEEIIRGAGGLRATEITIPQLNDQNQLIHESNHQPLLTPPRETTLKLFQYDAQRDSPSNVSNVLLLIVTLITTTTFQAGLSPPTFQNSVADQPSATTKPDHRRSNIDLLSGELLFFFMYCNAIAFFLSIRMINTLIKGFPLIVRCEC
ncbi:26S proteasome regulatory complex, subunit PSMD10 [Handroanthus impetiginosus]|uniref:26S proteasome regulatory complex, subunit PSMD10 n=1 Tax=Handroanthus impetiginosus TaxID=429701 RepID=A0A2G9HN70_9LAMI|nr:26S proteasome regulatory complex, subunit PSMD10 [Handroanthus impetiginosus]